jgi:hypothetical protein
MHHVHLAVAALTVCGANVMAQEIEGDDGNPASPDVSFAAASGMEIPSARSPLGNLAFGKVPAPVLAGGTVSFPVSGSTARSIAYRAEEGPAGGLNDARPVPEPPALLMLMAGLGVLGVVISRRH